jgi:DNA primase
MRTATTLPDDGAALEELLAARGPVAVLAWLGLTHRRLRSTRARLCCPFHQEHTPSAILEVGPRGTLRLHCFGACHGRTWDVHGLVAQVHGLDVRRDYPRVLEHEARFTGYELRAPTRAPAPRPAPRPAPPVESAPSITPGDFARGAAALLALSPLGGSVAVGLASRGVLEYATADGWGELPADVRSECPELDAGDGFEAVDLAASALVAQLRGRPELGWLLGPGGFVLPEHRLLIPWRAPGGGVWTVERRYAPRYGDETPPKGGKYAQPDRRYHQPPAVYPYGADAPELATATELWLVEGALDVLAVRALNARGLLTADGSPRHQVVLGLPGVGAWLQVRPWVLEHIQGRAVRVALDADGAGETLVAAIGTDCHAAGAVRVTRKRPPEGCKDWADVSARELGLARARRATA